MINARLVLLALSPLLLLGATCVTRIEQKGPSGPWTGEIVNISPEPMEGTYATGYIVDANGKDMGSSITQFCPPNLLPGEKGYFIVSEVAPVRLNDPSLGATPPLRLSRVETYSSQQQFVSGLAFRVFQVYKEHRAIMVAMRNTSPNTYHNFLVCAVLFSPSGEVQEIATKRPFPGTTFGPGEVIQFPVQFKSPVDGSFLFGVDASFNSPLNTILPTTAFELETYKIVETASGRELRAVGEIKNSSANDLESAVYEVYLRTSPTVRASGNVGPYGADFRTGMNFWDGNGLIIAGQKAPVRFSLPLDEDDAPKIEVAAIEAGLSEWEEPPQYFAIPVSNVGRQRIGADSVQVTATISNPTEEHMLVAALCFNLRGSNGKLVGTSCVGVTRGLEAGASLVVSEVVTELAPARSVEVIAYGFNGVPVTPPT